MRFGFVAALAFTATCAAAGTGAAPAARILVDDFEDLGPWSAHPADGVSLAIGGDPGTHGRALRLDFDFHGGGGYAVARRELELDLPANYRFRFAVRGACAPNDLEFKLVDSTGDNVWWCNRRRFEFPARWETLSTKQRQIVFAWGPAGGGTLRHVAAVEIAITAGSGGKGTVWLDDLTLEPLSPEGATPPPPVARASTSRSGHDARAAIDGDPGSSWSSAAGDARPWLALDLGVVREYGGLVVDRAPGSAADYAVENSDDGATWTTLREVRSGESRRDWLLLPESESRFVRLRAHPGRAFSIREVTIEPLAWGATPESFFEAIARSAPRGSFPRSLSGEQSYWAVVGADSDREESLLDEDGRLELGKAQGSIEPFLWNDGRLLTWADVTTRHDLAGGDVPIPRVTWSNDSLELEVTAFAIDAWPELPPALRTQVMDGPGILARYRVLNHARRRARVTLDLALRPFQVNPPTQFLNTPGGVAKIRSLEREGNVVRVNRDRGVVSLTPPTAFGAATFDRGDIVEYLRADRLPRDVRMNDPFAHGSGALQYLLDLPPRDAREVDVFVSLHGPPRGPAAARWNPSQAEAAEKACLARWKEDAGGFRLELPGEAAEVARTLRAQVGWILVNRDGPAIQPGSRAYERSWIRDGALTTSALLRLGRADIAREYLEWFAGHQFASGKIPCCIDARGADPVPEHDSSGELIFAIAEYHRMTGDREFVERLWPVVARAVDYLDSLRATRRTPEWRAPERREFFGLLPPSISHEGYSAKPMHSYWDDLFALRGFKDAAYLAGVLGRDPERRRIAAIRDEFQRDLVASLQAAMGRHHIDYLPGCADLGDFDATSTTVALDPVGATAVLPQSALRHTFEKYWEFFRDRRDGRTEWDALTPYEVRNIGAFVQLGWRERANELLQFFMSLRRPPGWAQWPEVVGREPRSPRFLGDLPHTWVGSDFVRSVLDMLAYEREADSALVVAAGVPLAWASQAPGVHLSGLRTPHGTLGLDLVAGPDSTVVRIAGDLRVPRGGIVVRAPTSRPARRATVNGVPATIDAGGEVRVRRLPATVVLRP